MLNFAKNTFHIYITLIMRTLFRRLFIISIATLFFSVNMMAQTTSRPKVAVVLSGGGAKGTAHVTALKVIEEAGVPIDMIVGTSMGSIIGGLYCYGYTTAQLDSLVRSQDWMKLLTNTSDRSDRNFLSKSRGDKYIVQFPLFRPEEGRMHGGLLSGSGVLDLFYKLMPDMADSTNFADLQIPFACVATDMVTDEEIDMYNGHLPECIRASMAIPGVFSPVRMNGMVLVDGGMKNNYPVDIARKMGADIVIGVNLGGDESKNADGLDTGIDILLQIINNITLNKIEENIKNTDVYINVNTEGFSSASFTHDAINTLMERGEEAARAKFDELVALRKRLNISDTTVVDHRQPVKESKDKMFADVSGNDDYGCTAGFGLRIDNEELASVLLGADYKFDKPIKPVLGAEVRLGRRSYGEVFASIDPFKHWTSELLYKFNYNQTRLYNEGHRVLDWDYHEQFFRFSFYRTWNFLKVTVAADYAKLDFDHLLSAIVMSNLAGNLPVGLDYDEEENINYYVSARFNNLDSRVYPTSGLSLTVRYTYKTDDWKNYEGNDGLSVLEVAYTQAIQMGSRVTFQPSLWGRFMTNPDYYRLGDMNMIGGTVGMSHYAPQQLPFAGVNNYELAGDKVGIVDLNLRCRIAKNQYLFGIADYGRTSVELKDFFNEREMLGAAVGYGYKTPIGPVEFNLNWSDVTDKLGWWLNIGYVF